MNFKSFFEEYVVGVVEKITLNDVGVINAKVDSGNSAYNAIHGENLVQQGNKVTFQTVNNKIVQREIQEFITINVGAGYEEKRPVVLFDVVFGDTTYKNVPFSISNRADNIFPVLLGKEFIKQAGVLIDVTRKNVIDKKIEVTTT